MRGPGRRRKPKPNRHLSLSATDAEWAMVSRNAASCGLSKARYLVGLVERDASGSGTGAGAGEDPDPSMALAPEEQRELLEAVRAIHALLLEDDPARGAAPPTDVVTAVPSEDAPSPDPARPEGPRQGRLPL